MSSEDEIGAYRGETGDVIAERFEVVCESGTGTFGRVLECMDLQTRRRVAIKVVRSVPRYCESARIEARILEHLQREAKNVPNPCTLELLSWFSWEGHVCIVTEILGLSLFDFLKDNHYLGFQLAQVMHIAEQCLRGLDFLHSRCSLVHTDLKPENILLCEPRSASFQTKFPFKNKLGKDKRRDLDEFGYKAPTSSEVKLIDFGGATYHADRSRSSIINTRQYRSPEVTLQVGWSYPSDMWSLGCILVELLTGELVFQTHDDLEHLALIERVCCNRFPEKMTKESTRRTSKFFHQNGTLKWPPRETNNKLKESVRHVRRAVSVEKLILREVPRESHAEFVKFVQLVEGLLQIDPKLRWTAADALRFLKS